MSAPHTPRQVRSVAVCIDTRDGTGRMRLHGVMQYGRRRHWRMMLVRHRGLKAVREVQRLEPDGIITFVADQVLVQAAEQLQVPLVDTALGEVMVPHVVTLDDRAVGRLAAEHFIQAGFRHFAYCGVRGKIASPRRRDYFLAHLATHGYTGQAFAQNVAEGESRIEPLINWLRRLPRPVGILCFDDKLGERVLTACRWADLVVPHQVAVLGVGDDDLMCEVSWPPLSSIRSPMQQLGLEAAAMLDAAMRGEKVDPPYRWVQPTGVSARGSTDTIVSPDPLIREAIQLIRRRAGEAIGVDDIARDLGTSRRTLDRRFKLALGRTVHDELLTVRMAIARRLLIDTTDSIAEIALACGYTTAASFSRSFYQYEGIWPTQYRSSARSV